MSVSPLVVEYFVVVSTLKRLVSEEVNFVEVRRREVIQTVGFIPALREDIEAA